MIDHVSISVSDLSASTAFYEKVLGAIGMSKLVEHVTTSGFGKKYPEFWINLREGFSTSANNSGMHVCLRAANTDLVNLFHAEAMKAGGGDDGAPGPRPEYDKSYYAAFITDLDGNRIEVVTYV